MPLIKHANADRVVRDAVVLDLGDLTRQAERILEDAHAQAAEILAETRAEAERLRTAAVEAGRAEGRETGLADGRESGAAAAREEVRTQLAPRLDQIVTSWQSALEHWERERREMLSRAREDVLEFAFEIGRRIVHRVVEVDPSVVEDQLAEALSLVRRPTGLCVVVHPEDRPLVESILPGLVSRIDDVEDADLVENDSIERGGCVVRMAGGRIDARLDTQLDRIAHTLLARSPRLRPASDDRGDRS
jgi:flagellar assembly protein FliH